MHSVCESDGSTGRQSVHSEFDKDDVIVIVTTILYNINKTINTSLKCVLMLCLPLTDSSIPLVMKLWTISSLTRENLSLVIAIFFFSVSSGKTFSPPSSR